MDTRQILVLAVFLLGPLVVFGIIYAIRRQLPVTRAHETRIARLEERLAEIDERLELTDRVLRDLRSRRQVPPTS